MKRMLLPLEVSFQFRGKETGLVVVRPEFGLRMIKKIYYRERFAEFVGQPMGFRIVINGKQFAEGPFLRSLQEVQRQDGRDYSIETRRMKIQASVTDHASIVRVHKLSGSSA